MTVTGVSEDSFVYTYPEKEVPVYCLHKRMGNLLSLRDYNTPIYVERTDCVVPMKHLIYENSDGVSLGLRCTVDCVVSLWSKDDDIYTEEVSQLKIGDVLYTLPRLYPNNRFKLKSIMDTRQDDMIYTFEAEENAVVVNGILLSILS